MSLHYRKTTRLQNCEYKEGLYFVTICTAERLPLFGSIVNKEMVCNDLGIYVEENLDTLTTHYPYARCLLYQVMPNHLHAIIEITHTTSTTTNKEYPEKRITRGTLSVVIRGFKIAITRYANLNNIPFAWHSRFHEHIIRHEEEFNRITDYIKHNPQRWEDDCYNDTVPDVSGN